MPHAKILRLFLTSYLSQFHKMIKREEFLAWVLLTLLEIFLSFWQTRACRHFSLSRKGQFLILFSNWFISILRILIPFGESAFASKNFNFHFLFAIFCYLASKSSQNVFECSFSFVRITFSLTLQMHIFMLFCKCNSAHFFHHHKNYNILNFIKITFQIITQYLFLFTKLYKSKQKVLPRRFLIA